MKALLAKSGEIAAQSLRSNYRTTQEKRGARTFIVCGPRVYQHVHGRDFPYAAGGALLLGDFAAVRDTLEGFFLAQRADGLFPRALAPWPPYVAIALEYVGLKLEFKAPVKAYYVSEQFVINSDCNALLVWTLARYAQASGDLDFARKFVPAAVKGLDWYDSMIKDGIFSQPPYSDWQDTVGRKGRVFYTNLCLWRGLVSMGELLRLLGKEKEALDWSARAERLRAAALAYFWEEHTGRFKNCDEFGGLDSASNVLAVAWGFVEGAAADRIFAAMRSEGAWRRLGPRALTPDYPRSRKSPVAVYSGMGDYHDGQMWSWITAMTSRALARMGHNEKAAEALAPMAEVILRDAAVGECYDDQGQVKRWLARSESPFSWGAGMWLEAASELAEK